jgi:hypothetical protein
MIWSRVYQTVDRGTQVVRGGFGLKKIAKIISDANQLKNTPMHISAKIAFVF